jgi:protoporphyrinogen oxidase
VSGPSNSSRCAILGAGLSGLSTAFHIGHENCVVYEAEPYYGGHIHGEERDGFMWDDCPHVSFTKDEYVRNLFAESVNQEFEEFAVRVGNYFHGHWIDHPAQSNFYQIPEPLRTWCLDSFLEARFEQDTRPQPTNYQEWLYQAFGRVFVDTFPAAYCRKIWTVEPSELGIDWVAPRFFYPSVQDVKDGFEGPLKRATHYVTMARYPSRGGFISFARKLADGARIYCSKPLETINFSKRRMGFSDGTQSDYHTLISTIPLPTLIDCAEDAPDKVRQAASLLWCTSLLVVEVAANHRQNSKYNWIYVYDEDKLSTRISFIEMRSPHNAPEATTGIQAEVYGSTFRPLPKDHKDVACKVQLELIEMGLLESLEAVISVHVRYVPWGNVVFDHHRQAALNIVNAFLDRVGVMRVGRYAEWKYLWTHDCVLNGKRAAEKVAEGI